jgi:hypothetical protein
MHIDNRHPLNESERLITFGNNVLTVKQIMTGTDITEFIGSAAYHFFSAYEKNKLFFGGFDPKEGANTLLRIGGNYLHIDKRPRSLKNLATQLSQPQVLQKSFFPLSRSEPFDLYG